MIDSSSLFTLVPAPGAIIPLHENIGGQGQGGDHGGADAGADPQVGPVNATGDGAAAAGNNPAVYIENQVVPNAVPALGC